MNDTISDLALIIVAAGSSVRFGGAEKQMQNLSGIPVFLHSVINLGKYASATVVACPADRIGLYRAAAAKHNISIPELHFTAGGETRTESVKNALSEIKKYMKGGIVAIHDGARPLAKGELLKRLVNAAREYGGAVPGRKITDTVLDSGNENIMRGTIPREGLWAISTPQVFNLEKLEQAYRNSGSKKFTDDSQVFYENGGTVKIIQENGCNMKITYPEDLPICQILLDRQ